MKALIIVDMQNDFMPGGALGVPGADTLIPLINRLIPLFPLVIASLDWHPPDHVSFATLWPVHCVQGSKGAELAPALHQEQITARVYKGTDKQVDSYSIFSDKATLDILKRHGVTDLFFVGVTTEYCVLHSALDALKLGFRVFVITDGCKPINRHPRDEEQAIHTLASQGGTLIHSTTLL